MGWASTLVRDHHHYHSDRLTHGGVASRLLRARHDHPLSALSLLSHPQVASISYSAWRGCRLHWTRVRCAPQTEQQDCLGKEEKERPQEGDEIKGPDVGNSSFATKGVEHDKASLVKLVIFWIFAAVVFGVGVGIKDGVEKASEFFAGYILEKSLSVDNLFVFILVFKYFNVPVSYQSRVLSYGISGAVVFRATMILLGTATLQRFEAVNLLLAMILIYSSYKLFVVEEEETDLSNNFIVKTCQKFIPITSYYDGNRFITIQDGVRKATPLLLTLAVIELSDIAFAIDSIPAVFGVTRDPFIVFSSNIFAILGLRSLYVLISETVGELKYLQVILGDCIARCMCTRNACVNDSHFESHPRMFLIFDKVANLHGILVEGTYSCSRMLYFNSPTENLNGTATHMEKIGKERSGMRFMMQQNQLYDGWKSGRSSILMTTKHFLSS